MSYTKEMKKEYFATLRAKLQEVKTKVESGDYDGSIVSAVVAEYPTVSPASVVYCYLQLQDLGLDGLPCIDCKTFEGWKKCGYIVKKGENSKLHGVTRLKVDKDNAGATNSGTDGFMIPKTYNLFHRSQVMELD